MNRSTVATVNMGLSHLTGARTTPQFLCGLVRGFGANLPLTERESLAKEVKFHVLSFRLLKFLNLIELNIYDGGNKQGRGLTGVDLVLSSNKDRTPVETELCSYCVTVQTHK